MQKCPKCGTILDDSKKTCYMCGTDLTKTAKDGNSFGDSLSKEIQNVVTAPEVLFSEDLNKVNSNSTNGYGSAIDNIRLDENISSLNMPTKRDIEPPKVEKKPMPKPQPVKPKKAEPKPKKIPLPPEEKGRFLGMNESKQETPNQPKKKINLALIINLLGFVFFTAAIVYAYFNYFKSDGTEKLGNLSYKKPEDLELKNSDSFSKYYSYGNNCTIKVSYGKKSETEGQDFVDSYLNNIKESLEKEENTEQQRSQITINDNKWETLTIIYIKQNDDEKKIETYEKYIYSSIFKDGEYYNIIYVNVNNDSKCKSLYDEFKKTLVIK